MTEEVTKIISGNLKEDIFILHIFNFKKVTLKYKDKYKLLR